MNSKSYLLLVILIILTAVIWFANSQSLFEKEIKNILLISIDTCRADYLSCYGYKQKITPNIDAVAQTGFLFLNTITSVPQTLPAHSTMLTGTTPLYHGIHDNLGYQLASSNITLAEILKEKNYKTGAVISSFVLDSQFGLNQGFDYYNDKFIHEINTSNTTERLGQEASEFAVKWIKEKRNEPFFLFLHYFDPHFRYEPPEPYASKFSDNLYAGEIAYTDECIGIVINALKEMKLYDSTLIIITGDHGEMLGEHGEAEHGYFIYQSAIRVPMIFKLPGLNKHHQIKQLVGLVDIVPTICGLLNIEQPENIHGRDLSACFKNKLPEDQKRYIYCESLTPTKHNANALLGIVTDKWKYIQTTRPELYNLDNDCNEAFNLVEKDPKRANFLRENLSLIINRDRAQAPAENKMELDEEGKKRLESLGYIASTNIDENFEFDRNSPDPKDFIKYHNIKAFNNQTMSLVKKGDLKEAAEEYKDLIRHYQNTQIKHDMATIHANLASVLEKLDNKSEAMEHYETAINLFRDELKKSPNSPVINTRIGDILAQMENFKEASAAFEKALALNPYNLLYYDNLATALQYQGDTDKAIEVLQNGLKFMSEKNQPDAVYWFRKRLADLETYKEKQEK